MIKSKCGSIYRHDVLSSLVLVTCVMLLTLTGCTGALPSPDHRTELPDFTLPDLQGTGWTLSAHRGSVAVLHFWATTCGPCLAEMPRLVRFAHEFERRGVIVLGITTDEDPQDVVPQVVAKYRIPYLILTLRQTASMTNGSRFPLEIDSVPRTILLDRAGRLVWDYRGVINEDVLSSNASRVLREPVPRSQK